MGWCFNVSFPFIRNSFSDFRDFYFQFLVLLVYNIQLAWLGAYTGGKEALRVLARAQDPAPEGMRRQPR